MMTQRLMKIKKHWKDWQVEHHQHDLINAVRFRNGLWLHLWLEGLLLYSWKEFWTFKTQMNSVIIKWVNYKCQHNEMVWHASCDMKCEKQTRSDQIEIVKTCVLLCARIQGAVIIVYCSTVVLYTVQHSMFCAGLYSIACLRLYRLCT